MHWMESLLSLHQHRLQYNPSHLLPAASQPVPTGFPSVHSPLRPPVSCPAAWILWYSTISPLFFFGFVIGSFHKSFSSSWTPVIHNCPLSYICPCGCLYRRKNIRLYIPHVSTVAYNIKKVPPPNSFMHMVPSVSLMNLHSFSNIIYYLIFLFNVQKMKVILHSVARSVPWTFIPLYIRSMIFNIISPLRTASISDTLVKSIPDISAIFSRRYETVR